MKLTQHLGVQPVGLHPGWPWVTACGRRLHNEQLAQDLEHVECRTCRSSQVWLTFTRAQREWEDEQRRKGDVVTT